MLKKLPAMLLMGAVLAVPGLASAQVSVNINLPGLVTLQPPPPRMERMPPPRGGQVWVPGHWQWAGNDYAWQAGRWQRARDGYDYVPGRWIRADGGWRWVEPDWRRGHQKPRKVKKHERWDDDQGYGRRHGHDDRGGYHCPPGQAKKGRC